MAAVSSRRFTRKEQGKWSPNSCVVLILSCPPYFPQTTGFLIFYINKESTQHTLAEGMEMRKKKWFKSNGATYTVHKPVQLHFRVFVW